MLEHAVQPRGREHDVAAVAVDRDARPGREHLGGLLERRRLRDARQARPAPAGARGRGRAPRRRAAASGRSCRGSRARRDRSPTRSRCIAARSRSPKSFGIEHALSTPTPCSPVSEPPASMQTSRIAVASCLGTLRLALDRLVVEHERVQVAVAGVEDARDAEAVLGAELRGAAQHLGQLRARHDAVLDVVARRDPAHRGERRLAPAPDPRALLRRLGRVELERAELAADPLDRGRVLGDLRRPGRRARRSAPRPRPPGSPASTAASTASIVSASIISIAAGRIPAAITCETASPAASVVAKPASSVRTASGTRSTRTVIRTAIPSVPSEPTNTPSRSGPVVVARERDELAVGEHDVGRENVVDGEPVLEAVGAARVLGDVAADRADLLARRVGRVVEALGGDRLRDVEVRHARLDDDAAALEVDLEDAVQPGERDHDAVGDRQRPAGEPGAGAARDERDAVLVAEPHDRLHVGRRAGSTTSSGTARWPVSASHS